LNVSVQMNVPVALCLDGNVWLGPQPDLWNWFSPSTPGYDPQNVMNVEWTDWSPQNATAIAWRDWGFQIR
jgi:hypothetical protein